MMDERKITVVMIVSAVVLALVAQHFGIDVASARFGSPYGCHGAC